MEAPPRIELGNEGFADLCLTAWLWRQRKIGHEGFSCPTWSGLRGSNPPPRPWQGRALPNELNPHSGQCRWCLRSESNQRHEDFQSSALPTELQRHIEQKSLLNCTKDAFYLATRNGLEPSTSSVTGWRANRLHHRAR